MKRQQPRTERHKIDFGSFPKLFALLLVYWSSQRAAPILTTCMEVVMNGIIQLEPSTKRNSQESEIKLIMRMIMMNDEITGATQDPMQ